MDNNSIYNSIIEMVEQQKKDIKLSTKLYRYTGLIQAIEFFSQKLNLEQIVDAAFEFVNEILTLEKSAVFLVKDNHYELKKFKGYESTMEVSADISNLHSLAKMHGSILYARSSLEKYFDAAILDKYGITALTPLIIDGRLYAFILMSRKTAGEMNDDDYIISEALMRLINNALDSYKRYEDLQRSNRELDEKIFNLFAINQSSKVLLSELELNELFKLSVDVFSELTQSSATGFVLFDEKSGKYALKAYKDVLFTKPAVNISLSVNHGAVIDINRIIIDISREEDKKYFNSIFAGGIDAVSPLKAEYIVLLIKNGGIIGFASLGRTITGNCHKASVFELIESLASATYIAISNAQYFKQVNDQSKLLDGKLKKLISLNKLVKNINSALKIETLLELTMKTLEVSFNVKAGMIAIYDAEKNIFDVANLLKIEKNISNIEPNKHWNVLFKGKSIVCGNWDAAAKYFSKDLIESMPLGDGAIMVPIFVERVSLELLGVIMIFKYGKASIEDEENILTIETIANHIAPVMSNLITMEEQKRFSLPNYIELFKIDLKYEISKALELSDSLEVARIDITRDFTFKGDALLDKLKSTYKKVYPFTNNTIFIILEENEKEKISDGSMHRLIGRENVHISCYNLGVDFKHYQDFFRLF